MGVPFTPAQMKTNKISLELGSLPPTPNNRSGKITTLYDVFDF